jgi:hypothetical protein
MNTLITTIRDFYIINNVNEETIDSNRLELSQIYDRFDEFLHESFSTLAVSCCEKLTNMKVL